MRWIAHVLLVTPATHRAAAAQLYGHATGRAEDATPQTYAIALTAIGGGSVTHWACHSRIRAATLAALPQLASAIPGALGHVTAHDDDTIEQAAARLGVEAWLDTQGLALWREEEGDDGQEDIQAD